jgi:Cys-rich peptide (TIGR04165 family)
MTNNIIVLKENSFDKLRRDIMKFEDLIAKCPKCGSTDKTAHRRFIDNHHAHAELKEFKCDNCGYIFETGKDVERSEEEKIKKELIGELNKKL